MEPAGVEEMRKLWAPVLCLVLATLLPGALLSKADEPRVDAADYRRAEQSLVQNMLPRLLNASVAPVWLPGGSRFWYKHQSALGWDYVAVDPRKALKGSAFDHAALAAAISTIVGRGIDASHIPLGNFRFTDAAATHIAWAAEGFDLTCNLAPIQCSGKKTRIEDAYSAISPDGRSAIFARADNIWLRDVETGEERQLTQDGEAHFSYGKLPDMLQQRVVSQTQGSRLPLYGVDWSPDSRHIVVQRVDERRMQDYYFLQMLPYDGDRRPKAVTVRTQLSGEADMWSAQVSIIDTRTDEIHVVAVGPKGLFATHYWDPSGTRFIALYNADLGKSEILYEITVASGAARAVLTEEGKTFLQASPLEYDEPAMRFLASTNEMIWYSQRDGWDHLYLIDLASGRVKAKITTGDWDIQNIVRVDEKARRVFFTAVGRERGEDPYWRHLYSVRLDGSDLKLLTPEPANHVFPSVINADLAMAVGLTGRVTPESISPDGRYMIDTYSTVEKPPVSVLKRIDGSTVMTLEFADAAAAYAAGWITPKPFSVKAADGKTDLYGFLILPAHFDPAHSYPVIDAIYNGPQVVTTPHDFRGALFNDTQAFAQLGFVAVVMDGRGTPLRSKAFQDYIYNNMQEFGVEDHVAAVRQLAAARPYMDITRVGLCGHSFGGYTALKGILGYPDFFKAAAASAGPYDLYGMYTLDYFFDPPVFKGGAARPAGSGDRPTNWGAIDLTQQADRLKGKLLLGYADLDENAYPAITAKLINALIAANKEFDLIYLPNRSHGFVGEPYFIRRRWDFFVRNLLGAEPPKDYAFGSTP
jgi:dipeptidyl-peptidase 4